MKVDVTIPELAESVSEAIMGDWLKKPGDFVEEGEQLVDVETDKVILEITAPGTGELSSIAKNKNDSVQSNEVIGVINTNKKSTKKTSVSSANENKEDSTKPESNTNIMSEVIDSPVAKYVEDTVSKSSPAVRKFAAENNIDIKTVRGTGKDGRITKKDVELLLDSTLPATASEIDSATEIMTAPQFMPTNMRESKRVPMTSLRKNISKRLVQSQHESAMLTTFNEVNMQSIIDLRQRYKESFEESHGVKLGFMSFFIKAAVEALKEFPIINASIEGDEIIYHEFFDIGVAVSTQRGLIVPIIRDAGELSFAGIEKTINTYANRAQENKLTMEELSGGTFTISNGGVFGSMMSTPIINPPQSAILV